MIRATGLVEENARVCGRTARGSYIEFKLAVGLTIDEWPRNANAWCEKSVVAIITLSWVREGDLGHTWRLMARRRNARELIVPCLWDNGSIGKN
jgi:hypothetical protein